MSFKLERADEEELADPYRRIINQFLSSGWTLAKVVCETEMQAKVLRDCLLRRLTREEKEEITVFRRGARLYLRRRSLGRDQTGTC